MSRCNRPLHWQINISTAGGGPVPAGSVQPLLYKMPPCSSKDRKLNIHGVGCPGKLQSHVSHSQHPDGSPEPPPSPSFTPPPDHDQVHSSPAPQSPFLQLSRELSTHAGTALIKSSLVIRVPEQDQGLWKTLAPLSLQPGRSPSFPPKTLTLLRGPTEATCSLLRSPAARCCVTRPGAIPW